MLKYAATVTAIGPLVNEFIDSGILVLFGKDAPEELAEFSVLHDGTELLEPLAVGDVIHLGDETFRVLAVGEVVNTNLAALGHLILKFNGQNEPEMPGDVCVEAKPMPPIEEGLSIRIDGEPSQQKEG